MDSSEGNRRGTADVKQLKFEIMKMKREIARKQLKLQKCTEAAKKRKNNINESEENSSKTSTATSTPSTQVTSGSPEIGLMGIQRSTMELNLENLNSNSALQNSPSKIELDEVHQKKPTCNQQENDKCQNNEGEPVRNASATSVVTSPDTFVRSIQAPKPVTVRRSSRISCESRLIASGEFLVRRNVLNRSSYVDNGIGCVKKNSIKKKIARIFPEFPASHQTINSCSDFNLPDVEFARLKLNVNKPRLRLNGQSVNSSDTAALIDDDDDDNGRPKLIGQLPSTTRRNEPIQFVHCGQLTVPVLPAAILSVIITVQPHWTSTWARTSSSGDNHGTNWCLLKTSRRDLESCHKTNMHGVQTSDVVASICIVASKDKQHLTFCINSCDAMQRVILRSITIEPDFHVMTGLLLSCCRWSGTDSNCEVGLANVWARTSRLHYIRLDGSVRIVVNENCFHEADDNLNALLNIDGLKEGLLGTSSSMLFIWNKASGHIVKTVETKGAMFGWRSCIFCSSNKGLLYMGMLAGEFAMQEYRLLVVNPNKNTWRTIERISLSSSPSPNSHRPRRARNKEQDGTNPMVQARKRGRFLVFLHGTSKIFVWKAASGEQVAHFSNGPFDEVTAYQCSHVSETLILIANQFEDVIIYSAD